VPILSVGVVEQPPAMSLKDIGEQFYFAELEKSGAEPKLVASPPASLNDGTPAHVVLFDCVAKNGWSLKISFLLTHRGGKLFYSAIQVWAFPEALNECLYGLHLHGCLSVTHVLTYFPGTYNNACSHHLQKDATTPLNPSIKGDGEWVK